MLGGGFQVPLSNVRTTEMGSISGNYRQGIVYLPLQWYYTLGDEQIIVNGVIRMIREKIPAFADLSIRYRNTKNPLLNVDWTRNLDGDFILEPPPSYMYLLYTDHDYSDIPNENMLCTVNGGRVWLLKFE